MNIGCLILSETTGSFSSLLSVPTGSGSKVPDGIFYPMLMLGLEPETLMWKACALLPIYSLFSKPLVKVPLVIPDLTVSKGKGVLRMLPC